MLWEYRAQVAGVSRILTLTLVFSDVLDTMAEPSWQEQIRLRLAERNAKQNAFASIIEQCPYSFPLIFAQLIQADRRLAQQTKLLKERNASLLKAVGSVRANPSSSTVYIPGTASGEEYVAP